MTMKNTNRTEEKCFGSRFGPSTVSACMHFIQHTVVYESKLPFLSLL